MSFDTFSSSDQGFETEAVVKWFNLTKGFGFVAPADGSADAFLHSSVVNRAGMPNVGEGTKLLVKINDGPKGRQVASIMQVLGVAPVPQSNNTNAGFGGGYSSGFGGGGGFGNNGGFGGGGGGGGRPQPTGPEDDLSGTVKWFKPDKGFGFVTPDDGGRDVFVHRSVLLRAGLQMLDSGQKVHMKVQTASKGREATEIQLV